MELKQSPVVVQDLPPLAKSSGELLPHYIPLLSYSPLGDIMQRHTDPPPYSPHMLVWLPSVPSLGSGCIYQVLQSLSTVNARAPIDCLGGGVDAG